MIDVAFPNFYNGYQPYYQPPVPDQLAQLRQNQYQPMQQPTQLPTQPTTPASNSILWVQGEAGAKSYLMAPNTTLPLWDSENQTIYIKSTDASGMPSMRILDYVERTASPRIAPIATETEYVTRKEFDALKAKFDALAAGPASEKRATRKKEDNEDGKPTV